MSFDSTEMPTYRAASTSALIDRALFYAHGKDTDYCLVGEPDALQELETLAILYPKDTYWGSSPGKILYFFVSKPDGTVDRYPYLYVKKDSVLDQTIQARIARGGTTELALEGEDLEETLLDIPYYLGDKFFVSDFYKEHARLVATSQNPDLAYVVFDEIKERYIRSAENLYKDRRGVSTLPTTPDGSAADVIMITTDKGEHKYQGFYIHTNSPEYRMLTKHHADKSILHVHNAEDNALPIEKIREALRDDRHAKEDHPKQHRFRALYRNAIAIVSLPGSLSMEVIFDANKVLQAQKAHRTAWQNVSQDLFVRAFKENPAVQSPYFPTVLNYPFSSTLIPAESEEAEFLRQQVAQKKIENIFAVNSQDADMQIQETLQSRIKITPRAELN